MGSDMHSLVSGARGDSIFLPDLDLGFMSSWLLQWQAEDYNLDIQGEDR